jgi:hypothetical protein
MPVDLMKELYRTMKTVTPDPAYRLRDGAEALRETLFLSSQERETGTIRYKRVYLAFPAIRAPR